MKLSDLISLQAALFLMMLTGALLRKKGILDDNGKKCLSDLCIQVVIPCNIFKSCLLSLDGGILPACALALGTLLHLDATALGVSVLMTGMPAGATAAIFAARYGSDARFATQCVVFTTLLSMISLPIWAWLVG